MAMCIMLVFIRSRSLGFNEKTNNRWILQTVTVLSVSFFVENGYGMCIFKFYLRQTWASFSKIIKRYTPNILKFIEKLLHKKTAHWNVRNLKSQKSYRKQCKLKITGKNTFERIENVFEKWCWMFYSVERVWLSRVCSIEHWK